MFARVIVDISSGETDRIFDYFAPEGLKKGQRVLVPFGGRKVEGYVIDLSETTDFDVAKIKEIESVLDKIPVIGDEMFLLADFLRARYNLRMADALRLFIPAQMRGGRVKELTRLFAQLNPEFITGDVDAIIKPAALAQRELYDYLLTSGGEFVSEINKNYSVSALKNLTTRGVVVQSPRKVERIPFSAFCETAKGHVMTAEQLNAMQIITGEIGEWSSAKKTSNPSPGFSHPAPPPRPASGECSWATRGEGNFASPDLTLNPNLYSTLHSPLSTLIDGAAGACSRPTTRRAEGAAPYDALSKTYLIHGVTGSGKTEVYMNCISAMLKKGKTAIMLVPEIALTPQIFARFKSRFGDSVAILHSGLTDGERFDEWMRLLTGQALVAVGARSAIFAPLTNLGIIIIDEEHDQSYNSESNPRYITSEVAEFRAKHNGCPLVLGSATPAVETYHKTDTGACTLIEMNNRINNAMPKVKIVNMCNELYSGNNSIFSAELYAALSDCLEKKNQAMLFINRRGYSSFLRCMACGYVVGCERCDVSLVYHKDDNALKCHYCGMRYGVPDVCPKCSSQHFRRGFLGTQQVVEKLSEIFPTARVLRMDNDTTQTKDAHAMILSKFKDYEADILVGTQMIAKGHDFPAVTLVGILDADVSLHFSDYKAAERTFSLITQAAGRAGRADKEGFVVLQTYSPSHYVYRFAVGADYRGFYKKEINLREVTGFPPFADILRVLVTGEDGQKTAVRLKTIYEGLLSIEREHKGCFLYLSYMFSPVKKVKDLVRMQVLCRVKESFDEILKKVYNLVNAERVRGVSVFVEINPNNLN
ncbi:MAG: primosomal protein N' [Firmicutes bacterium]|nr:primosomal protein N' [Bacillota bacterium]